MGDVTGEATPNKIISTKDHEYRRWTDGTVPNRQDLGSHINNSIFGAGALANPLPKYRFPAHENRPEEIFQVVSDELYLDGNARQNLATFCQTWEEPEVHKLMDLAIDKNMIDKDEYPQTAEIEIALRAHAGRPVERPCGGQHDRHLDHRIHRSLHARRHGAEVALAGAQKAPGKPTDKPNLVAVPCRSAGTSFAATGTSRCAKSRCSPGRLSMDARARCWKRSTRTRSPSCRPSA